LQPEQAVNAATIEAVGASRGLPERAVTIALATAMQESGLRNIAFGDRDSLGLFQQRPSQGWGDERQIMDPVYAAGKFYDHLVEVPGYSRLPLTVAAQQVQRSGFPQAYAKHEPNAALLAAALTGRTAEALSCTTGSGDGTPGDPARVREKLTREFGADVLAGADAAGQARGPLPEAGRPRGGGKSSPGPVVVVPVPSAAAEDGPAAGRRGWEVAHWAVAHSSALHIAQVSYGDRVWSAQESRSGWRAADGPSGGGNGGPAREVRITTAR
jgi:hypothetical protein